MNIRQLKHFLAVARTLNFGRAAEQLNITQPPLSQSIIRLEKELDVKLFVRDKKSVALTPAGAELIPLAERFNSRFEQASANVIEVFRETGSIATLGYTDDALSIIVPDLLLHIAKCAPGMRVRLFEQDEDAPFAALKARVFDILLTYATPSMEEEFESALIAEEAPCVVVRRDDPLAAQASLPLESVATGNMIVFPRLQSAQLYDELMCSRRPNDPPSLRDTHLVASSAARVRLTAAGMGPSVVSNRWGDSQRGVIARPIAGVARPPFRLFLVWHKNADNMNMRRMMRSFARPPTLF